MKANCFCLTDKELDMIHETSLKFLKQHGHGIKFLVPEAVEIFAEAGFSIEGENIVKFSPQQVEDALKKAPSQLIRHGADESLNVNLGGGEVYLGGGSLPIYVVEAENYQRRQAKSSDLVRFGRMIDALENLSLGNGVVQPWEIPTEVMHAFFNQNAVVNIGKPTCCWYATNFQVAKDNIEILSAAVGGRENLKGYNRWAISVCQDQPMSWGPSLIGLLEAAKASVPVEILVMPISGSMHPVTLAGTIAQANAEVLSAVVLAQLINPGCPVVYAPSYGGIMDMAVGSHCFGTPETALQGVAFAQLGKHYGLPTNITASLTDSKIPDGQAAYEKMMTTLPPILAGADCMTLSAGMIDFGLSASYEQLVIDNEIAGQVLRIRRGFEVTEDTLALNVMEEVGPGGTFLTTEHTLRHFRREHWMPKLSDRQNRQVWESKGAKSLLQRAQEQVKQLWNLSFKPRITSGCMKDVGRVVKDICRREKVDYDTYRLKFDGKQ